MFESDYCQLGSGIYSIKNSLNLYEFQLICSFKKIQIQIN